MIKKEINERIKYYVENNIIPMYQNIKDKAHQENHIRDVINSAFKIAKEVNEELNPDIIYVAAAYHDIGLIENDRKNHHLISASMFIFDKEICKYFNDAEKAIIFYSILTHRASLNYESKTIYDKIISDADKFSSFYDVYSIINRTYKFAKIHKPDFDEEERYNEVYNHLKNRIGENGYSKLKLNETMNLLEDKIKVTRNILSNENLFKKYYMNIIY